MLMLLSVKINLLFISHFHIYIRDSLRTNDLLDLEKGNLSMGNIDTYCRYLTHHNISLLNSGYLLYTVRESNLVQIIVNHTH